MTPRPTTTAHLSRGATIVFIALALLVSGLPTAWAQPTFGTMGSSVPVPSVAARPHPSVTIHASALTVNPRMSYSSEPAPMGIADFGVTPSNTSYSYRTPIFLGDSNITRLKANDGVNASGHGYITLQLNVVLVFRQSGANYSFWIQDVASVDTIRNSIGYLDNIWNFSNLAGTMPTSSVAGNGTVNQVGSSQWYSYGAPTGLPGNFYVLPYPTHVRLQVKAMVIRSVPTVAFQYDDGFGWITYDNATFGFARGASLVDFLVDGTRYAPIGIFYDAELDYAGPGGTMHNLNSSMRLTLDFWNGHNFQSVPNAWNFGANTGETIDQVVSTASSTGSDGAPGTTIASGTGTLGPAFGLDQLAVLNVTTLPANATLIVGGTAHPYRGREVNLTLAPGAYVATLVVGGTTVEERNLSLSAGQFLPIRMGFPIPRYNLTFSAHGLGTSTPWSVAVNGTIHAAAIPWIQVPLPNGTFSVALLPVPGFVALSPMNFGVSIRGADRTASLNFTTFNFTVTFIETGLPAGTLWWASLNGTERQSVSTDLVFTVPNGTLPFTIGTLAQWYPSPAQANATVSGGRDIESILFSLRPGAMTGTVFPTSASVTEDGVLVLTTTGAYSVSLLPGSHILNVSAAGYAPYSKNVSIVAGETTWLNVSLLPVPATSAPSASSLPGWAWYAAIGVAAAGLVVVILVLALRRRC